MTALGFVHDLWNTATSPAGLVASPFLIFAAMEAVRRSDPGAPPIRAAIALGSALVVVVLTQPLGDQLDRYPTLWGGFYDHDGSFDPRQAIQNLALFVPIGALSAPWVRGPGRPTFRHAVLTATAAVVALEAVQLLFIPGRNGDLSDVLMNVTGFGLGLLTQLVYEGARRQRDPQREAAGEVESGRASR